MKKIISAVVVLGIDLLVVGALYGHGGRNSASPSQSASVSNSIGGAQAAPAFSLSRLGGGTINLADYKGKKPVILDFWASWCPNCQRDMPHLNALYQTYKDKVEVIGINLQEDQATVGQFISSQAIAYPIALDPYSQASQAYGIQGTNTHVLIDKNGDLVKVIPGDIQESDITSLISG